MNWIIHAIVNLIIGLLLFQNDLLIHSISLLFLFVFFTIIIDLIDHTLFFMVKYPKRSPLALIKISRRYRKAMKPGFYIFHSPEFNFLLLITAFFSNLMLLFFISNIIHIILDFYEHTAFHKSISWMKEWSVIYQLKKVK